nr:golgin subfamily B member 1-like [Ipomoea batatas]
MVSELAGEGAMPLPAPASHAELRRVHLRRGVTKSKNNSLVRLPQPIRSGSLLRRGVTKLKSVRNSSRVVVVAFSSWRKSMENLSAELVTIRRSSRGRSAENSSTELTVDVSSPQRRTRKKLSTSTSLVVDSVSDGRSPTIPIQNSSMDCRSRSLDFVFARVSLLCRGEQSIFDSDFACINATQELNLELQNDLLEVSSNFYLEKLDDSMISDNFGDDDSARLPVFDHSNFEKAAERLLVAARLSQNLRKEFQNATNEMIETTKELQNKLKETSIACEGASEDRLKETEAKL